MKAHFAFAVLLATVTLGGCATGKSPMEGSAAGSAADPLSTAARERAGTGCPATSAGMPLIVGSKGDEPEIARTSPGRGTAGQSRAYAIPPGGEANTCN